MRTLLILVDGMRPDALENIETAQDIIHKSSYTMEAKTVMPSVTLPRHMSLFHSVDPSRHGTDLVEDMTIPIIINGKKIEAGKILKNSNIKDIAPTVAKLLDVEPDDEWEGVSLL